MAIWQVVLLGLIEGLTEFIPVSSTGHILLAGHFLGFKSPGKTFEVLIQLGAVMAVLSVYMTKLWKVAVALPSSPAARHFFLGIIVAFLPAAVIGAGLHGFIKTILFESPILISCTLIAGGIVLIFLDRLRIRPIYTDIMHMPTSLAFKIGLCQCLALIPGVSRSGSTIAGAILLGTDKRTAAEFSFFLAMPTMSGAFAYDLYKNWNVLDTSDMTGIAVGFICAFAAAVVVVKGVLEFISRHGYAPFGWWRIIVGGVALGALLAGG